MAVKNMLKEDRPRERLMKFGASSLANEELLAIILKTGTKDLDVIVLSKIILSKLTKFNDLSDLTMADLISIRGIGEVKALEVLALIELSKRLNLKEDDRQIVLSNAKSIYEVFFHLFENKRQEMFYAIYLDQKKKLIAKKLLFVGTLNMSIVHPREVFKYAYLNSAAFIICLHNHPSGDVTPSAEDIEITRKLKEIGLMQQIYVIDHVIIGNNNYYSFYENE